MGSASESFQTTVDVSLVERQISGHEKTESCLAGSGGTHNPNLLISRRTSGRFGTPERDMVPARVRPILSQRFSSEESEQVIVNFTFGVLVPTVLTCQSRR